MATEKAITPQIFHLMAQVLSEVESIQKSRRNEQQNYKFRGIDEVYAALHPVLSKYGVFVVPRVLDKESSERITEKGTVLRFTELKVAYDFFAPDGSSVTAEVVGEAMDSGDKSSNKAMSAAHKYALLQTFCIPTGDQPDADASTPDEVRPARSCPQCGKTRAVIKGKPEFGGGWLCFKKKGGCGATWADGEQDSAPTASLEDVTVNALREQIKGAAQALNDGGDLADDGTEPRWTIQSINAMAKEHFGGPVASLKRESLEHLAEMFSQRLEDQRNGAAQRRQDIIASIQASAPDEEVLAFLQEHHDGKTMEELTTVELNNMSRKVGVPF